MPAPAAREVIFSTTVLCISLPSAARRCRIALFPRPGVAGPGMLPRLRRAVETEMSYPGDSHAYSDSFQVSVEEGPFMLYVITLPLIGVVFGVVLASRRKGG